jgi:hypothetical protein
LRERERESCLKKTLRAEMRARERRSIKIYKSILLTIVMKKKEKKNNHFCSIRIFSLSRSLSLSLALFEINDKKEIENEFVELKEKYYFLPISLSERQYYSLLLLMRKLLQGVYFSIQSYK